MTTWAYGITTVPSRFETTLPGTLESLKNAGFNSPRLFVDGDSPHDYRSLGLDITYRSPATNTFTNWLLAATELLARNRTADRFVIFQDDVIACPNLRSYVERHPIDKSFLNLYTVQANHTIRPDNNSGWFLSDQHCRGALGLVFDHVGLETLLASSQVHQWHRTKRGFRGIDTVVSKVLIRTHRYREYVHNPSLLQHMGQVSTQDRSSPAYLSAPNYIGDTTDPNLMRKP